MTHTRVLRCLLVAALTMVAWPPVARAQNPLATSPANAVQPAAYDVYFDLDRFTPRAEMLLMLDDVARAMFVDPTLNLNIEGHTCDLGSAEYNLALGDRRATAVKDYLSGRGIAASRLRTASYGEEDPEHANTHDDTRRLNRRVALVVRLKP